MASVKATGGTTTKKIGGGTPLSGGVIRDNLRAFRTDLTGTIKLTRSAIAAGDPKKRAIRSDGVLQGSELTKAKAAVRDMERALKSLSVNVPTLGVGEPAKAAAKKPAPPPGPVALYGMVLRDDLQDFTDNITQLISDITAGLSKLRPAEKADANKALAHLRAALKDLSKARKAFAV